GISWDFPFSALPPRNLDGLCTANMTIVPDFKLVMAGAHDSMRTVSANLGSTSAVGVSDPLKPRSGATSSTVIRKRTTPFVAILFVVWALAAQEINIASATIGDKQFMTKCMLTHRAATPGQRRPNAS